MPVQRARRARGSAAQFRLLRSVKVTTRPVVRDNSLGWRCAVNVLGKGRRSIVCPPATQRANLRFRFRRKRCQSGRECRSQLRSLQTRFGSQETLHKSVGKLCQCLQKVLSVTSVAFCCFLLKSSLFPCVCKGTVTRMTAASSCKVKKNL